MSIENDRPSYFGSTPLEGSGDPQGSPAETPPSHQSYWPGHGANGNAEPEAPLASDASPVSLPADRPAQNGAFVPATAPRDETLPEMAKDDGEESVLLPNDLNAKLPGFTKPASDCINKARRIARELNHISVSAAHLALALTLDPRSSRRLRDQNVDVDLVREAAVRNLGKFNFMYASGQVPAAAEPKASPDLTDILEAATRFAHEREDEEEINISDLLDAFRKSGSGEKLIYAVPEAADLVPAVIRRVEQGVTQQLDQIFAEMDRKLQAASQFEQLFAEMRQRMDLAPQLDQMFDELQGKMIANTEERLAGFVSDANAQLA